MRYCVLLDAIENKAVVTPIGKSILDTAYTLIGCNTVQLVPVRPNRLPKGFEAVCDEDTYGKLEIINPLASWLYGCDDHGVPVSNNVVVFKVKRNDFTGMTMEEATEVADYLNGIAEDAARKVLDGLMTLRRYG